MKKRFLSCLTVLAIMLTGIGGLLACVYEPTVYPDGRGAPPEHETAEPVTVYFYNNIGWLEVVATVIDPTDGSIIAQGSAVRDGSTNFFAFEIARDPVYAPFVITFGQKGQRGGSQSVVINCRYDIIVTFEGHRLSTRDAARVSANRAIGLEVVFARAAVTIGASLDSLREHLTVVATYLDGSTRTLERYDYMLRGLPLTRLGEATVSVHYQNRVAAFDFVVNPRYATHLSVVSRVGAVTTATVLNSIKDSIDVYLYFSDGTGDRIANNLFSLSAAPLTAGSNVITVIYGMFETDLTVTATEDGAPPAIDGLSIDFVQGDRQIFANAEVLDNIVRLISVNAYYGDVAVVLGMDDFDIAISAIAYGEQAVTVTYQGLTAETAVSLTHVTRVFFYNALDWDGPIFAHIWHYIDGNPFAPFGAWPGLALNQEDDTGWFYLDVPLNTAHTTFNMMFNFDYFNRSPVTITNDANVFVTNANSTVHPSRADAEAVEPIVIEEGEVRIWFFNSGDWSQPRGHAWDGTGDILGLWNSATQNMTRYGTTDWWWIDVPRVPHINSFAMIIFNPGLESERVAFDIDCEDYVFIAWHGGAAGSRHSSKQAAMAAAG